MEIGPLDRSIARATSRMNALMMPSSRGIMMTTMMKKMLRAIWMMGDLFSTNRDSRAYSENEKGKSATSQKLYSEATLVMVCETWLLVMFY